MLNFLNSAVLIAAVAALIPLLIHLFSRRRVKVVEFSSLKHLKEMQKRQVRRIKLRQLLLLILRMLIVLVAVLAFARPASKGGYIGSHAGVSSVILLDRSASMQRQVKDGILFELARKSVSDILDNFGQSDELILIPFDRQIYFPAGERFFSRDVAENILSDAKGGYDEGDFENAFNRALTLLEDARNLNKELYIITDRQYSSLPETVDTSAADISHYLVNLPVETDGNCGVIDIDMGGQLIEVGSDFVIKAQIQNHDAFAKSQLLASLFVDGVRVMQTEFALEENGKETVQFKHTVHSPGFHSGWIEISDDSFLPDNKYYFSFRIPDQFNILIVDGDGSGELIRLALVPSEKLARYWSVKSVEPEQMAAVRLGEYDVVVITGIDRLGTVETSQLFRYLDNGGGLFFISGSRTDPAYFNNNLAAKVDVKLINPPPAFFSGAGYYTLERFDYSHPIFKAFDVFQKDSVPTLRFYALPTVEDGDANLDLAFFSNGAPAVVEAGYGLGRIILMTAPIAPKYTDISSHSFFVPFVIRTMEYLANDLSKYELRNYVGRNVQRLISGRVIGYGAITMVTPDNRTYEIAGIEKGGQLHYDCQPIDMPGIYQLRKDDKLIDLFPANLPPSEGDLAAADLDHWEASLRIDDARVLDYDKSFSAAISEARFGRELWKIFLWAAAVLLAVEMLFAREAAAVEEQ